MTGEEHKTAILRRYTATGSVYHMSVSGNAIGKKLVEVVGIH